MNGICMSALCTDSHVLAESTAARVCIDNTCVENCIVHKNQKNTGKKKKMWKKNYVVYIVVYPKKSNYEKRRRRGDKNERQHTKYIYISKWTREIQRMNRKKRAYTASRVKDGHWKRGSCNASDCFWAHTFSFFNWSSLCNSIRTAITHPSMKTGLKIDEIWFFTADSYIFMSKNSMKLTHIGCAIMH